VNHKSCQLLWPCQLSRVCTQDCVNSHVHGVVCVKKRDKTLRKWLAVITSTHSSRHDECVQKLKRICFIKRIEMRDKMHAGLCMHADKMHAGLPLSTKLPAYEQT